MGYCVISTTITKFKPVYCHTKAIGLELIESLTRYDPELRRSLEIVHYDTFSVFEKLNQAN